MNKLLVFSIAALGLIVTPALAADIAVKAPPVAPAPVPTWSGWYAGVNLGASFGHVKTDFNATPVTLTVGGLPFATVPGVAGSDTEYPSGFIGGGQIGYNWQYSPLIVVGLEADFQGALERDTQNLSQPFSAFEGGALITSTALTNYTTNIDWFGTVRGRIGYVWGTNGDVLTYVTGGLAYGEVKINGTSTVSVGIFSLTQSIGQSQVNTGWVVGFGTEGKLLIPGWTYKIESLYMDLGTLDATGVTTGTSAPVANPPLAVIGGQVSTHTHFTDAVLRVGLNYKFY